MANTQPLTDILSRAAAKTLDVVTDPAVHDSVREVGRAIINVARTAAQAPQRPVNGSGPDA